MTPLLLLQQALRQKAANQQSDIDRIANRLEPKLRKIFLEAVIKAQGIIDLDKLARLILSGNLPVIEHEAGVDKWTSVYSPMKTSMREAVIAGARVAADKLGIAMHGGEQGPPSDGGVQPVRPPEPPSGSLSIRFDLINHHAVTYADKKLPKLAEVLKENGREMIRGIVAEAVSGKYTVQTAAKQIREHIGLTARYSAAVEKLRADLIAQGVTGDKLEGKVQRYSTQLLNARAKTIARTEIIQAQVAGQRALWHEAVRNGVFDKSAARTQWSTTEDERTCPICAEMDGQEIPFGGEYVHPELGHVNVFGDPLVPGSAHPNCRCREKLIL